MNWNKFLVSTFAFVVQEYVDYYKQMDLDATLDELAGDYGLPRVRTYDFVVVGAGTAGSLVASKLANDYSVLLLEEGGPPPPEVMPPYFNALTLGNPLINKIFDSVPQKFLLQQPKLGNRSGVVPITQGSMLGGCGSHNGNLYSRGSPYDYNFMGYLVWDRTWEYQEVLPLFREVEKYEGLLLNDSNRNVLYGNEGPLHVETIPATYLRSWLKAGEELGYSPRDPNGYQSPSFAPVATSTRNALRDNTYTAFVQRRSIASKLRILPYCSVDSILFKHGAAYGVLYYRHGFPQITLASKEVIIAAGAIGTPMLLIKSGIGPKGTLKEAGISPIIADLPVGSQLFDHIAVTLPYKPGNNPRAHRAFPTIHDVISELENFHSFRRHGFFARSLGAQAFIASTLSKRQGAGNWADIQLLLSMDNSLQDKPTVFITILLTRPNSRGHLGFNSTAYKKGERDWSKLALADFKGLADPNDKVRLLEGLRMAKNVMENTDAFASMGMTFVGSIPEKCKALPEDSDTYWICFIEAQASTANHLAGTCRMGRHSGDRYNVVDAQLKVKGVRHLRVVDSSVLPYPTNAEPSATVTMVAAKAAHEILKDNGNCPYRCNKN